MTRVFDTARRLILSDVVLANLVALALLLAALSWLPGGNA